MEDVCDVIPTNIEQLCANVLHGQPQRRVRNVITYSAPLNLVQTIQVTIDREALQLIGPYRELVNDHQHNRVLGYNQPLPKLPALTR